MSLYAFITSCRGRLHHLKKTLPRLVAQSGAEVIVVDYNCPDGTAAFVAENFPAVKLVVERDAAFFNLSRARNMGAQAASGEVLIFVDADVLIAPDFTKRLATELPRGFVGGFSAPTPKWNGIVGSCVVEKNPGRWFTAMTR